MKKEYYICQSKPSKWLEVRHYGNGHYAYAPFTLFVGLHVTKNWCSSRKGNRRLARVSKTTLDRVIEDGGYVKYNMSGASDRVQKAVYDRRSITIL